MLFIRQSTNIPIPKVYALFEDKDSGFYFIVMENMPGKDPREIWRGLDDGKKENITDQLRCYLNQLRSLRQPGRPYFGGPLPFQLGRAMLRVASEARPSRRATSAKLWERVFHSVFQGHEPVFTHGDLTTGNILLRDDGTVAVIDWERSGWHPSCWEYCAVASFDRREDDWVLWVPRFLDEYHAELGWMLRCRSWAVYDNSGL
ncbi:hypothetical protein QBC34DRAFT_456876 [Podospora aff. communis PSN243]|uniref:non-specific serine/threonine protein kinase n=1 Tax=Podospora aff. communis PSN243 TaxID=3040156 RepID=A0AAV9FV58_9PEZI|nr:hypothetical protein QBC34DRAFT_456876 [Podospora aff. communis PSN243]